MMKKEDILEQMDKWLPTHDYDVTGELNHLFQNQILNGDITRYLLEVCDLRPTDIGEIDIKLKNDLAEYLASLG